MNKHTTKGGKEIELVRDPRSNLWKVQFTSGGQIPEALAGVYTNETFGNTAIASYLAEQEKVSENKKVEKKVTKAKEK
tara:strand:+ start:1321 stop:1554 length:234 start_codon:yes stop_codon:yes gene_type:complete